MAFLDPRPEYWAEYSNLQKVKHDLIRHYLQAWFPKLGFWAGRIVYWDTHAGRGTHAAGQLGSPLVALDALLNHTYRDRILSTSDVSFFFVERDERNAQALREELAQRGQLPARVKCFPIAADCFQFLTELIQRFKENRGRLAPSFFFIDPYGFKVPGRILRELMEFGRVELFITVIWRELDMAMAQPDQMADTLNEIFDGDRWRDWAREPDAVQRAHKTVEGIKDMTKARWFTYVRMLGDNNATRYLLLHLTNHDAGRDLMKDCVWKVCPDGGFYAAKSDDPNQPYLIEPEPDLVPLRSWVLARLPSRWRDLEGELRTTLWRKPHLNQVLRDLRQEGIIDGRGYAGKFTLRGNPELFMCDPARKEPPTRKRGRRRRKGG